MNCSEPGCEAQPTHEFTWPGTSETFTACEAHAKTAQARVAAMGRELELRPLGGIEFPRGGSHATELHEFNTALREERSVLRAEIEGLHRELSKSREQVKEALIRAEKAEARALVLERASKPPANPT